MNDFFYKDSTLYAAYSYYYPDGNYDYKLSVWKDDKLQYTGKLDYIISKPSAYQDYMHYELYSIKFERWSLWNENCTSISYEYGDHV